MATPTFNATYRQYKQDTNYVASWLAATARAFGYPANLLTNVYPQEEARGAAKAPSPPQPSKRLKGKARKLAAKSNQATPAASTPAAPATKYIVAIKDFVPLADWIASWKPEVQVPDSFANALSRVIHLRSNFGAKLSDNSAEEEESHAHFISVLEKLRASPQPRMSTEASEASTASAASDGTLENKFASLNIYEPTAEDLEPAAAPAPVSTSTAVKTQKGTGIGYEAEKIEAREEALLAYFLMFQDLHRIRKQVHYIWVHVLAGSFDTAAAALATNTAIDLARDLFEDAMEDFEGYDVFHLCGSCHVLLCLETGFDMSEAVDPDLADGFPSYEVANYSFANTVRTLMQYLEAVPPGSVVYMGPPDQFGVYNPHRDWKDLSGLEKVQEDGVILSQTFTELMALHDIQGFPVEDEMMRGLREALKSLESPDSNKRVPYPLVFAAQILVDVHHILRGKASAVFEHNMSQPDKISKGIDYALKSLQGVSSAKGSNAEREKSLNDLKRKISLMVDDPIHKLRELASRTYRIPMPSGFPSRQLLRLSPIISGLLLYRFRYMYYGLGNSAVNSLGATTSACHLYNALKNEELLEPDWKDMDLTRELLEDRNLYVGNRPTNREDYFKSFLIKMGVKSYLLRANLPAGSRPGAQYHPNTLKATRKPVDVAPISQVFLMGCYALDESNQGWKADQLDEILRPWRKQWDAIWGPAAGRAVESDDEGRLDRVVGSLALVLDAESRTLAFPWLAMESNCWKFLRELTSAIMGDIVPDEARLWSLYTKESELPWIMASIFREIPVTMRRMELAGKVMHDFIRKRGDTMERYRLRTSVDGITVGAQIFGIPLSDLTTSRIISGSEVHI